MNQSPLPFHFPLLPHPFSSSQWDLPPGVEAAEHLVPAAPVTERDQRRECPHCREQPALLLRHRELDQTVPGSKPEGSRPQQPEPTEVL